MNKYGFILGILLVFNTGIALQADETSADVLPGYVDTFLNNQFLVENARLIALAEEAYAADKYDEAIRYAAEADRYAQLSDEYISLQMKIKEVNDAIASIETLLNRAKQTGADKRYAETFEAAGLGYQEALDARSREDWDKARDAVLRTIALLETLPAEPILPAQYLVINRDCLWNIAAKPEIYGDPFQWRRIYNANRDKLPRPADPNLIVPGIVLDIPSIRGEQRFGRMQGD